MMLQVCKGCEVGFACHSQTIVYGNEMGNGFLLPPMPLNWILGVFAPVKVCEKRASSFPGSGHSAGLLLRNLNCC